MGAELARKRAGKRTKTGMSESQLEDFATMDKKMKGHMGTMMKSHMPAGAGLSPTGDIGAKRQEEATKAIKAFKGDGEVVKTAGKFGAATPNASRAGTDPKA